ncbi:MAG TPA: hypothetical protein VKY24_16145 [Reyranella sp.]|nr:hypothetical protein [Reyranella sp.]
MSEHPKQRAQSAIEFPYRDLESSIGVAKAIADAGNGGLSSEQLAAALKNAEAGNFYNRVASARMFGLVTSGRGLPYKLAPLGYAILSTDGRKQRDARVKAFLEVPLYQKLFDTFRGEPLPPRPHGLQRVLIGFGVPIKVADRARHAFERSARFAGFFDAGEDRLTLPALDAKPVLARAIETPKSSPSSATPDTVINDGDTTTIFQLKQADMHPFVQGLLLEIPKPGQPWPLADRVEWLRAAVHNFNLIYKSDGEITISGTPKAPPKSAQPATAAPGAGGGHPATATERSATRSAIDDDFAPPPRARGKAGDLDDDIPF